MRACPTLVALLLILCCLVESRDAQASPVSPAPADSLQRQYGLELLTVNVPFPVETTYGRIEGADATQADAASYLKLLIPEWSLYPPALVQRTGLRRIILCRDLSYAGQKRTAVPDFEHNDLYFDVARGRQHPDYVRKVIHHEYYHLIDWRDDRSLYADPLWSALNGPGIQYGSGGVNAQSDARGSLLDDQLPGFLTGYSKAGVEEDKAELFANLLVSQVYVLERSRKDPVLNAKVQRMKLLMWRFVPEMDLDFWSRAAQLPRE